MKALLIAEKPDQMRQIKEVYLSHRLEIGHSIDFLALHGHILALKEPKELNKKYEKWSLDNYPTTFDYEYRIKKGDEALVSQIKRALDGDYDFIIHAGDPDQEGQLLVDEVLYFLNNQKPVKRFWTSDMTDEGIKTALINMKSNAEYSGFYLSALMRMHLDMQFGMNLTVAATVKFAPYKVVYRIGRVKAAMLAIVTEREKEIQNFVPKTSYKKAFKYQSDEFVNKEEYETANFTFPDFATVTKVGSSEKKIKAPKLYDLTSLQSDCYKMFGWSGAKTLDILQALYLEKLVSYPRTDCRYLPTDIDLVPILGRDYPKTDKDYFNNKAIATEGHTAIIPTGVKARLSGDQEKLYNVIDRSFKAIFAPVKITKTVKVVAVANKDDYTWSYTWNLQNGYELVLNPDYEAPAPYNNRYSEGMDLRPIEGFAKESTTKPPARFNEGSVLKLLKMETEIDGETIEFSIGTPATRASIVKECVTAGYFEVKKGVYYPTELAWLIMEAIGHLPIFNYKLTAEWEKNFKAIQAGEDYIPEEYYIEMMHDMVNQIKNDPRPRQTGKQQPASTNLVCPKCGEPLVAKTVKVKGKGVKVFTHAAYPNDCGFTFWREFLGATFTEKEAETLMAGGTVEKRLISNKNKPWKQKLSWSDKGYTFIK